MKNQQKLNERELSLGLTNTSSSWHKQYEDSAWVFVGGLPYELTEGDVICIFSQYGELVNVNLVRDKDTGKSKGYAFLCYEDQRSTILAVDNLNGARVLNRAIRVDHKHNYQVPKDRPDDDDLTKQLRERGCAPVVTGGDHTSSDDDDILLPVDSEKRKKKKKKKKDKKKKVKSESCDDSSAARANRDERSALHGMEREYNDDGTTLSTRTDGSARSNARDRVSHSTDIVIKQERRSLSPESRVKTQHSEVSRITHEYLGDVSEHRKSRSEMHDSRASTKSENGRRSPYRSDYSSDDGRDRHSSRTQHVKQLRRDERTFDRDRSNSNPRYRHRSRDRDYGDDLDRHRGQNKHKAESHHDSRRYK